MERGCICVECFNYLVRVLVDDEEDTNLIVSEASVSDSTPTIDIPYEDEKGIRRWKEISPDARYCCHCGSEL